MSVSPGKSLVELSEPDLFKLLRQVSEPNKFVNFGYNDILQEIERRRMMREASRTFKLSIAAIMIAALSLFASVLLALFGR